MHLRAHAPFPIFEGILAALLAALGFALTTWLFFPGLATHDALAVYDQAYEWKFGDWQPPLMGVIWVYLEPVFGYGPFVMTSREEIVQAIDDFNSGKFGRVPA